LSFTAANEADADGVGEALDVHPAVTSAREPSSATKIRFMANPPTLAIASRDLF
jgi:hypothetical protein